MLHAYKDKLGQWQSSKINHCSRVFSADRSEVIPPLQFLFVHVSLGLHVTYVLSLIRIPHINCVLCVCWGGGWGCGGGVG